MSLIAEQLGFDFFFSPEVQKSEKPDWLVKAESLVSTLTGPKGTTFVLPKSRYETVSSRQDLTDIDTTRVYQRSITLADAGFLGSGKFIKNENGKVRLLTDEDELIVSSHLAEQGFLVSQYPNNGWRFQKKFLEALRNHTVSPFPEPLKDYSDTLYRYFLSGLQFDSFDPEVRNLGEQSITEIEQLEYFSRWYGFEPFIHKVVQDDTRTYSSVTAGSKFNRYLTDNQYLDFDRELFGKKAFFSEKFKEDMKRGTLAPFPPELSQLNSFKEELFNDIGKVFGIDTPQLAKIREGNNQSFNEDFSTNPTYQWVKQNAPTVKEIDGEKILNALETPGLLMQMEKDNRFLIGNPERSYQSTLQNYKGGKTLDEAGEKLLERAARLSLLEQISHYACSAKTSSSEIALSTAYVSDLAEISRAASNEFFKHRDSLKHNKDGSLKLEDFGEDLNNTRKGRGAGKKADQQRPYDPVGDLEKRLASNSLEKVWPKESIIELYKKNPKAAACLWLVREALGERRPKKGSYPYRSYLKTAAAAINLHRQVVSGKLAPEAETEAFDSFYNARYKYETFSHINPKYWKFFNSSHLNDAKNICEWNHLNLSDGTDINSYKFQCILPGAMNPEDNLLSLKTHKGVVLDYYAVAVGNTAEEFEKNIEKQLSITFADREQTADKASQEEKAKTKPELPIQLFGRGRRDTNTYEIYGKQGSIELQLTEQISFESDEAFWSYCKDHRVELESKYRELRTEYSKTEKDWRNGSPIRERIGPDWRNGKDATPGMFMNTFGFRGVEFGNWVKQGKNGRERQWMLNNAFDALYDLSKILNIPPKAVALDGELGLCFGSRGFGSASAHYEPKNRIINLTKTKGYSSLAHEWFHALDHYIARTNYETKLQQSFMSDLADSRIDYFLSENAKKRITEAAKVFAADAPQSAATEIEFMFKTDAKIRRELEQLNCGERSSVDFEFKRKERSNWPERVIPVSLRNSDLILRERGDNGVVREVLHDAWADTINSIRNSDMHRRMLRKNDYWHSKIEEAARSFEAFVSVRSKEMNVRNDFLTNDTFSEKTFGNAGFYPYLDGKDVQTVASKFERLFKVLKTRETEKGIALYSKSKSEPIYTKKSEIRDALVETFGKEGLVSLVNNDRFYLAQTEKEALSAAMVEQKSKCGLSSIALPQDHHVLGFHDPVNHKTYLIADNLTRESACAVMLHEIGVHMANDSELRDQTQNLIKTAVNLYEAGLKQGDPLMERVSERLQESKISPHHVDYKEEVCGYLVEEAAKQHSTAPAVIRLFNEFKSTVNVWLVKHGVRDSSKLTALDIATIAKANVKELAKLPKQYELSKKGKEVLAEHVKSLSTKYSKISDADAEIRSLYKKFSELEQAGKALPRPKISKDKEHER